MFCEYCGVQMEPKSSSCNHCGAKIRKQDVEREKAAKAQREQKKEAPTVVYMRRGHVAQKELNIIPIYYAGFWHRVAAKLVDMFIIFLGTAFVFIFNVITSFIFEESIIFGFFLIGWLYYAVLDSSSWQGTVGKRIVGLKVCDLQGNRISFLRATCRYLCQWLSFAAMYIGFLMVAFTDRKQALHDMMTSCIVVEKK